MKQKLTPIPALTKMFINREPIQEFVSNDRLYKVAKRLKADTSLADRLNGKGFISQELQRQISIRVNEINPLVTA